MDFAGQTPFASKVSDMSDQASDAAISERLERLASDAATAAENDAVSLFWILDQLHERAFGLFLLVLALPCCIPFLYGVPQVMSLPLMFVSVQILIGRKMPWLPAKLGNRTVSPSTLRGLSDRAGPWLKRIEALSKPRLGALTRPPIDRLVGAALVLFSASILVPLPSTNTVPGFAVVIVAMGLLQRDGLLVIAGAILGTAWIGALIFAGATIISLIRDMFGL